MLELWWLNTCIESNYAASHQCELVDAASGCQHQQMIYCTVHICAASLQCELVDVASVWQPQQMICCIVHNYAASLQCELACASLDQQPV